MKVISPKWWAIFHVAIIADAVQGAIDHWKTNTKFVKRLIIGDAAMVAVLLFLVAYFG